MATTPVFLPWKSHGERMLVGFSPWGHTESDTTEPTYIHTHTHTQLSFSCHDHMGSGGYERVTARDGMTSSVPLTAQPTVFWPHSHPHPSSHLPSFAKLTLSLPRSLTLGSKVPLATAKAAPTSLYQLLPHSSPS